jgi:glutathione peroxidase
MTPNRQHFTCLTFAIGLFLCAGSNAPLHAANASFSYPEKLSDPAKPAEKDAPVTTSHPDSGAPLTDAYAFAFDGLTGDEIRLDSYRGHPILIVNTASKCGFTPQYEGLEQLWQNYRPRGLVVIGVPSNDFGGQEPGDAAEIKKFCAINYGVSFPLAAKQVVKGDGAHPFYQWAKTSFGSDAVPKWNFHKILIGVDGRVAKTWSSLTGPGSSDMKKVIEAELAKQHLDPAKDQGAAKPDASDPSPKNMKAE